MKTSDIPSFIIILGRPGSGKGTQAKLLEEKIGFKHLSTGRLLRKRAEQKDFLGKKLFEIMNSGGLVPTPLVFQLWMPEIEDFHKNNGKGIIFDGSPRKLYEAQMLNETLDFYGFKDQIIVLNVEISEKESMKRLLKRGRHDDDKDDIERRFGWFKEEVLPVIDFYRKKGLVIDINGEQSIEDVQKEITEKLKIE